MTMATCIEVKYGEKKHSKVDSALMAEHISVQKCKHATEDLYRANEKSKKQAKPDAVSAAANTQASAAVEKQAAAEHLLPLSLPMCLPPSPTPYIQMHLMHMPVIYPLAHFPAPAAPLAPYSQPIYIFQYQYLASQPASLSYQPMFLPYTFPPPS
jgi:hypothetical protein